MVLFGFFFFYLLICIYYYNNSIHAHQKGRYHYYTAGGGGIIIGFVRKSRTTFRSEVKQLRRVLGHRNDYCYPIKTKKIKNKNEIQILRSEAESNTAPILKE